MVIVVAGYPATGFSFHGPFPTEALAKEWAQGNVDTHWTVEPLLNEMASHTTEE